MVSDKARGRIDALTLLEDNDPEPDLCLYEWRDEDKDLDLRVWYLAPLSMPSFSPTIPSLGFESDIGTSYTITNASQNLNMSNEDRGYLIVGFKASDDTDSESNVWQICPQGNGFTFYNAKHKRYLGALGVKVDCNPFVWKVHKLHYGQGFRLSYVTGGSISFKEKLTLTLDPRPEARSKTEQYRLLVRGWNEDFDKNDAYFWDVNVFKTKAELEASRARFLVNANTIR